MSEQGGKAVTDFAGRVLAWFDVHGRKNLPWQQQPTPYRVWVSEIMLQQTQVTTVIPFYQAFVARFPDVGTLASAAIDDVLHHWSGLGYYARARHLHHAAQIIARDHGGDLPDSLDALMALPGIGRSTAGAVLALAHGKPHPILDGNVKRVLARFFAVEGYPGEPRVQARLWQIAEACTPRERVAEYTQAMMDLGATVCVRRRPVCAACPLSERCAARLTGRQAELPTSRPHRTRRARATCMLLAVRDGRSVLLERRPPHGIWGGLWGLPEFSSADVARDWCIRELRAPVSTVERLARLHHAFTHFDLDIEPVRIDCTGSDAVMESDRFVWYDPAAPRSLGLAAPVRALIESILPLTPTLSPEAGARETLLFPLPLAGEG